MNPSFIVCAYYTDGYRGYCEDFIASIQDHNDNHFELATNIYNLNDLGGWVSNTSFKPFFIRNCMINYPNKNILFIDIDAKIKGSLDRFNTTENDLEFYYRLNHHETPVDGARHICTGIIYLRNRLETFKFVNQWINASNQKTHGWEQPAFQNILFNTETGKSLNVGHLPQEYCNIIDGVRRKDESPDCVSIIEQQLASYKHAGESGKIRDKSVKLHGR